MCREWVARPSRGKRTGVRTTNRLATSCVFKGGLWWALAGVIAVWLLWMTLRPNPTVAADLAPLTESARARRVSVRLLIGLLGNVGVFVPLGMALVLALGDRPVIQRLALAVLIGSSLSLAIELAQIAVPSRVTAMGDWLLNAVGTTVGALLGLAVRGVVVMRRLD